MLHRFQKITISLLIGIGISWITSSPGLSDAPSKKALPSEAVCFKALESSLEKVRTSEINLSEKDKKFLFGCRKKMSPPPPDASLPTANQCSLLIQKSFQEGLSKSLIQDYSEKQIQSLSSCEEVIKTYYMRSVSMLPTLQTNDRVIVDKNIYHTQLPRRGDIVVFQPTEALRKENFKDVSIKRIVGLPGETFKITNGIVYINGKFLSEDYILERDSYQLETTVIPANNYFVLGDNRNTSHDSRHWGSLPSHLIVGKIIWRYYPLNHTGSLYH
jgi:signal peptidase I